jgi:hypothetical protein
MNLTWEVVRSDDVNEPDDESGNKGYHEVEQRVLSMCTYLYWRDVNTIRTPAAEMMGSKKLNGRERTMTSGDDNGNKWED